MTTLYDGSAASAAESSGRLAFLHQGPCMIRDAHQLLITRQQRQLLADALHDLGASSDPITELQRASLEGQIADLDNQVADYERTHPSSE